MAVAEFTLKDEILAEVKKRSWVHSIDLGHGIVTPGAWGGHNPLLWTALRSIDFQGKKVLDIGCWDGLFTFEAEKLGADQVYATDYIVHRNHQEDGTFELAAKVLGSNALYHPKVSVYDIESLGVNDFDVVIFAGIYYHLKDPLRALTALRRVTKEGGLILVEGEAINSPECFAKFHYHEPYVGDKSNWWIPTGTCLKQWVESSFFEIESDFGFGQTGVSENPTRYILTARAVSRKDPFYSYPDEDLQEFDRNTY